MICQEINGKSMMTLENKLPISQVHNQPPLGVGFVNVFVGIPKTTMDNQF